MCLDPPQNSSVSQDMCIDKLRTLLVSTSKESAFRKVVQATMVRDKQHGPVIELNRITGMVNSAHLGISCCILNPLLTRSSCQTKRCEKTRKSNSISSNGLKNAYSHTRCFVTSSPSLESQIYGLVILIKFFVWVKYL